MEKLKKYQTLLFVDISDTDTPEWARIGKSTIYDLTLNAEIETNDYIEDETPTDEIKSYKPSIAQELATLKGEKVFDYLYNMLYMLPTGEAAKRKVLNVFAGNIGTAELPKFKAWQVASSCILKNLNTVDEKILFDLNFGGNIDRGTAVVADGVPTFTTGIPV